MGRKELLDGWFRRRESARRSGKENSCDVVPTEPGAAIGRRACVSPGLTVDARAKMTHDDGGICILGKYFGVHDKSLKELYTSTATDASFFKVRARHKPRWDKTRRETGH